VGAALNRFGASRDRARVTPQFKMLPTGHAGIHPGFRRRGFRVQLGEETRCSGHSEKLGEELLSR